MQDYTVPIVLLLVILTVQAYSVVVISRDMTDTRAILSDIRDALNCQTYDDAACL